MAATDRAERADESFDEPMRFRIAAAFRGERFGEQLDMFVERARDVQQAAVDVEQVVEVNRPFLVVLRNALVEHGVHRLADDRRFEKRARVQADDGSAVVHRIEVVVLRLVVDRVRAPERDVPEPREVDVASTRRAARDAA